MQSWSSECIDEGEQSKLKMSQIVEKIHKVGNVSAKIKIVYTSNED